MQTYDDCELILGNQYWYISLPEPFQVVAANYTISVEVGKDMSERVECCSNSGTFECSNLDLFSTKENAVKRLSELASEPPQQFFGFAKE